MQQINTVILNMQQQDLAVQLTTDVDMLLGLTLVPTRAGFVREGVEGFNPRTAG